MSDSRRVTSVIRLPTLLPLLWLGACSVAPVAPPAPFDPPTRFKQAAPWQRDPTEAGAAADTANAEVPEAWWSLYRDPVLDNLQQRLSIGSETLKIAVARVDSARALLAGTQAAEGPTLSSSASATAARTANNGNTSGAKRQVAFTLGASASWEIDLWGRLGLATQGDEARYQASRADLAAARLSAQAALTQTYFALRSAQAQQAVLERSVAAYQRSLELTKIRHEVGVTSPSDVLQAQTQLKTAQVQALDVANQRDLLEHAVATLLGLPPSSLDLPDAVAEVDLPTPPAVPPLLPATLLQRRPDIAAAERRVGAAYAQIGVAEADLFPRLMLSASGGARGINPGRLLDAQVPFWSLGAALAQTVFDGGARRSVSDRARASADEAAATYRLIVITALQEVEDNLVLADRLQSEVALQREALQYAQRHVEITQEQYRVGTVNYLNVVTAQTTALNSERNWIDLRTRQIQAVNQLLKNIGGRW